MPGRHFFVLSLIFLTIICEVNCLTEKQVVATVRMIRNTCQPKSKASTEDIDKMHQGDWNIDHTAMCYLQCALSMYKLMNKENKFDYESGLSQLKILPDSLKEYSSRCMNECRDSAVTLDDKCIAAYEIAKCFYFCDPEKYFLP